MKDRKGTSPDLNTIREINPVIPATRFRIIIFSRTRDSLLTKISSLLSGRDIRYSAVFPYSSFKMIVDESTIE